MNKRIILTQGLPASGKSTWAKEQEASVITKDDIRLALHKGIWSKINEKEVIETERDQVKTWMQEGTELIIVDNTHIGKDNPHIAFYRELAEKYGYEFEIKTFDTSYEECIERDAMRGDKKVGWKVIKKFNDQIQSEKFPRHPTFKDWENGKPACIIVDIDGTLSFSSHRSPYDYSKVGEDDMNQRLKIIVGRLAQYSDTKVIILSGRDDDCLQQSADWLIDNEVKYDEIYFRKTGDKRNDAIVKKEIYEEFIKDKYNVLAVFDDRDRVVDMWREEGLPTYQVYYGNF